jgi:hypothetical protein
MLGEIDSLFAWLISHQLAVLFSHNKPATSNQPRVLFSQNKPAPALSHQPNEQAERLFLKPLIDLKKSEILLGYLYWGIRTLAMERDVKGARKLKLRSYKHKSERGGIRRPSGLSPPGATTNYPWDWVQFQVTTRLSTMLRTMCGTRSGGWSFPGVMSD